MSSEDQAALASNPRASLDAWERYEPIVLEAFNRQPGTYKFTPSTHSPKTICSRIRDAVRGKLVFDYPSTLATPLLEKWWQTVIVYDDGANVFIGPKEKKGSEVKGHVAGDFTHTFRDLDMIDLQCVERLLSKEKLKGPIQVINHAEGNDTESTYSNIQRIFKPDGSLVLL